MPTTSFIMAKRQTRHTSWYTKLMLYTFAPAEALQEMKRMTRCRLPTWKETEVVIFSSKDDSPDDHRTIWPPTVIYGPLQPRLQPQRLLLHRTIRHSTTIYWMSHSHLLSQRHHEHPLLTEIDGQNLLYPSLLHHPTHQQSMENNGTHASHVTNHH